MRRGRLPRLRLRKHLDETKAEKGIGRAYAFMEYYFRAAVAINAIPFTYDRSKRHFSCDTGSRKFKIWFVLMFLGILAESAQMTYELVRANLDPEVSREDWSLIYFPYIGWSFITGLHFNILINHRWIVNHLNQAVGLREWFSNSKSNTLPPSEDHKIVRAHMITSCLQCFFQSLLVSLEGYKAQFVYSNVPMGYRNGLTAGLWAAWATYRVATNFLCGYFHYFVCILHVQTCNQVLELRNEQTLGEGDKLRFYRMLQILSSRFSEAHSQIFIPGITAFAVQQGILGVYCTVKFYSTMPFDKYINFPIFVSMVLIFELSFYPKNATVYEGSCDVPQDFLRQALKGTERRKTSGPTGFHSSVEDIAIGPAQSGWALNNPAAALKATKCIARSCPVIGIHFGSLYIIERSTAMNVFDYLICNTISTLITYP